MDLFELWVLVNFRSCGLGYDFYTNFVMPKLGNFLFVSSIDSLVEWTRLP